MRIRRIVKLRLTDAGSNALAPGSWLVVVVGSYGCPYQISEDTFVLVPA